MADLSIAPRVMGAQLQQFVGKRVRLIGQVGTQDYQQGPDQFAFLTLDQTQIMVHTPAGSPHPNYSWAEVTGTVAPDGKSLVVDQSFLVIPITTTDNGGSWAEAIQLSHHPKFQGLFMDDADPVPN